jgi:glucose-1-phosphate cytidylyltransferase
MPDKVVILCGGQGTRIREASESLPKPMLPIGGRPILWHIMKGYASHGLTDFVLCLGYRGWLIKQFFLNYRAMTSDFTVSLRDPSTPSFHRGDDEPDWSVTLADTGEESMTGYRVHCVRQYVEDNATLMLTYGDGVANVDIAALAAFHHAHGKIATVTAVRPPSRFGELVTDGHLVTEFNEKPQASSGFINGGFMVLDAKRIWSYLSGSPDEVFEREPMQRLARDRQLVVYEHRGFWQPMDTPREYALLNELWSSGNAPWKTWSTARKHA